MRRTGRLWPQLVSFDNLLQAAERSAAGKGHRPAVAAWYWDLERNLCRLLRQLQQRTSKPGGYTEFYVHEPRRRLISAAPYGDRVVHHALTQVLGPVFERRFISDSYPCRVGRATHAAVRRAQHFSRRFPWVLKADSR
jgi:RNA-directed DNA polymerase